MPLVYAHQIFSDSDLQFSNGSHFGTLYLICAAARTHSRGNFTCSMHKHKWPYYMLITFLVILTYSFEMAAIWYFSLVCCQ